MKKIGLLITAAFLLNGIHNATAQDDVVTIGSRVYETKKFRFGAFVAPTISYMKPTTSKSDDNAHNLESGGSKVGFTWGLMAEYWFAENYGLVSGIQMNMARGNILTSHTESNPINGVKSSDIHYKLNYLEIPLNLKMKTDPIENFTFFGQVGLDLGINIAKRIDYSIVTTDGSGSALPTISGENEKLKGTLAISPVLLAMNIGVGVEYPINNRLAGYFGVFFNNGFLPDATFPKHYQINNVPDFQDGNIRVNNFAFRLGLFF